MGHTSISLNTGLLWICWISHFSCSCIGSQTKGFCLCPSAPHPELECWHLLTPVPCFLHLLTRSEVERVRDHVRAVGCRGETLSSGSLDCDSRHRHAYLLLSREGLLSLMWLPVDRAEQRQLKCLPKKVKLGEPWGAPLAAAQWPGNRETS